jgi:hypothetical protein
MGLNGTHAHECLLCPKGKFSSAPNQVSCSRTKAPTPLFNPSARCPLGKFSSVPFPCATCPCVPCPAGSCRPNSAKSCVQCPRDKYQTQAGGSSCANCRGGQFSIEGQVSCVAGIFDKASFMGLPHGAATHMFDSASSSPTPVPTPRPTPHPTQPLPPRPNTPCPLGSVQNITRPVGSFSSEWLCGECLPGSFDPTSANNPNPAACKVCPRNKFQGKAGKPYCSICRHGFTSDPGLTHCSKVFKEDSALTLICDPGKYTKLLDGITKGAHRRSFCFNCPKGKFADGLKYHTSCLLCVAGKFQGSARQSSCQQCASGQFSGYARHGESACVKQCAKGSYERGQQCVMCLPGFYQPTAGQVRNTVDV